MTLTNEEKIEMVLNPKIIKKIAHNNITTLERKRKSLPKVELNEVEYEFLIGLINGRSKMEIAAGLSFLGEKRSYNQILAIILKKFDAINLPNAIYKACKMGIIK